ncbi:C4-dicarboxylate TRAP transporter substrate-binding protein [Fusobacterium mortiferum]|jgi:TRAP-type C4-dicarboxylate transport system substrate-binding protein|uniref:C4-dicarboxylate TRAP transporter substrate-binding protein n=1 Tax=Fusobacterium mortiferum TaxID=850 RepID=UPI001F3178C2|nr:C4-dicarboxylate TRAP transporter substrate-binding protein [Fusobacterium mortiferum]MCF2698470.1 C4-dicarboxylate TRAP transporter substrate-binding protein [Fusobacterium mortiferum]
MKGRLLKGTILSLMLLGIVGCGGSKEGENSKRKYELKVSTTQAESSIIVEGLQELAKKVEEKTEGGLKITVYPSSSLGVEEDIIDQAIQGMNVAVLTDAGRMADYVSEMGIFNMAYFVDNYDEALKVMETETFKGWKEDLITHDLRILTFNYYDGARSFMGHKEAKTPNDLKGIVVRTPGAAPYVESMKAMGATPYNIAWSEVYNGIQTKSIDACEVQYTSAVSSHIYEVCKVVNKTEHINLLNCLVTSEIWFNKLPEEYKKILIETAEETAYANGKKIESLQVEMEKTLVDNGMKIVEVDKEAFKEAVKKAYDALNYTQLREKIYKEIGKN